MISRTRQGSSPAFQKAFAGYLAAARDILLSDDEAVELMAGLAASARA